MDSLKEFFEGKSAGALMGLALGVVLILGGAAFAAWHVLRIPQAALFSDLPQADAAEIAAKLEEWKTPHHFSADGREILVAHDDVHALRMRLVSEGVPSGGRVGFELFKDADFGVTEFAQQVNYQRGLQGELERTIAALQEVASVRVHLTLPRTSGLLRGNQPSKASVALALHPGSALTSAQVSGIQNLVASAVQGLPAESVVVVDQNGRMLTGAGFGGMGLAAQLDEQGRIEERLRHRLDDLLGNGFALTSYRLTVDAELNFDRVSRVSERLLEQGSEGNGLLVRNRTDNSRTPASEGTSGGESRVQEREWAHGREREETAVAPGRIARLSIALVVPMGTTAQQLERLRKAVAAAVAFDEARGDRVEVIAAGPDVPAPVSTASSVEESLPADEGVASFPSTVSTPSPAVAAPRSFPTHALILAGGVLVALLILLIVAMRPRTQNLSVREREALAEQLKAWMDEAGAAR
jgi:flagellar M-ring protein FliF